MSDERLAALLGVSTGEVPRLVAQVPDVRERWILRARYGLGRDLLTLEEVALTLDLSRESVRRLEIDALTSLKKITRVRV